MGLVDLVGWRSRGACIAAVVLLTSASAARADDDLAFENDVAAAINDGLLYLRNQNAFDSTGVNERLTRGLVLLALLEKRQSASPAAPITGYANASPLDQALATIAFFRAVSSKGCEMPARRASASISTS